MISPESQQMWVRVTDGANSADTDGELLSRPSFEFALNALDLD